MNKKKPGVQADGKSGGQADKKPDVQEETAQERIRYLEQINRLSLDSLEQAVRLGDFQTSINQMESPDVILEKSGERILTLIPFQAIGFYLVNEEESEFYLSHSYPEGFSPSIKVEVEHYIENGTFAWAIREQRPIFVPSMDHDKKIVLHILTTTSRIRGMFVGLLAHGEMEVPLVSLSLMSIILRHSANALESFELYGMIRNINKNLEETVKERTKELERSQAQLRHAQKMEALGRLAGGVAHDFNNILTAITIASEVSLQQQDLPDTISRSLKDILNAAERATNLTRQLLAVSRKQIITPKLLDLNDVVKDINRLLSRLIVEDIEILVDHSRQLLTVKADPSQVEQVLINLAVNAQYAIGLQPESHMEKIISIQLSQVRLEGDELETCAVSQPGDYILIRFSDTGVGIEPGIQQKIFEPFFTTKKEEGTGLGLATVYGIIKQNNGGITVSSTPGKGTCFNIYWPCINTDNVGNVKSRDKQLTTGGKETILLVEDDAGIRSGVERLLLSMGYHLLCASNGKEAMDLVREFHEPVQILFTDITMPVMDGKQLAEILLELMPDIKIIFTTGYTDSSHSNSESLPMGSVLIQKPYSIADITRTIRKLLD